MGLSRQESWSGLPLPPPVHHVLSELFTLIHLGWPCTAWLIASVSYAGPFTATRLWPMKGTRQSTVLLIGASRWSKTWWDQWIPRAWADNGMLFAGKSDSESEMILGYHCNGKGAANRDSKYTHEIYLHSTRTNQSPSHELSSRT